MRVVVTTSNAYLHLIPVFTYLFNKYWSSEQEVTILGYEKPSCELPANFKFESMGTQGDVSEWSTDLRRYFESIPDQWFIIMMEDCFVKRMVNKWAFIDQMMCMPNVGRIDLTNDIQKRPHSTGLQGIEPIIRAHQNTNYRVSLQPSVWNKDFLLKYLTPGLTPWEMEKQHAVNDGWEIIGLEIPPVKSNEGVRKHNPYLLDLNGFSEEDVKHIKSLL